jgi:hypothetical protein
VGYPLGRSDGSGFDIDCAPGAQPHEIRVCYFDPFGKPVHVMVDTRQPPVSLVPEPEPEPLPDIPWTPDHTRTVDMLDYVTAATSARIDRGDGTGELWLHKSQERPNWGENWDYDRDYIGFVEDRSTGTRMVSMERPKTHSHTNTTRNRLSPEEILERNARGENLGDYRTLPLAGYTWRGNRVWMPRHVTGARTLDFRTDYVWWDEPQYGGVWEIWKGMRVASTIQTGYARFNGHDVYARQVYFKNNGDYEANYWGPHGWIAFTAYHVDGSEELAARRVAPPEQRASSLTAPFVAARFVPTYPIWTEPTPPPDLEPDDMPLPNDEQMVNAMRRIHVEGYMGELRRAGGIFDTPGGGSVISNDSRTYSDGSVVEIDDFSLSVWTGRYVRYFSQQTDDHHERAIRAVLNDLHNSDEARQKRGEQPPVQPPPVTGQINGRLRVEAGRLRDDAGFVNYQAMSAFCLIGHAMQGREDEVIRQLDRAVWAGRNAVRVFAMLDPQNGGFGPVAAFHPFMDGWNVAANFVVNEAAARGLRVQINIFADAQRLLPAHASRRSAVHTVAGSLRAHDAVWFRLANEPYQNGWSGADDSQLLELADLLAELIGHRDFAIGDVKDDGSESGSPENREQIRRVAQRCNFLMVHSDRAEQAGRERPIEHMKSVHETYDAVAGDKWLCFDENRGFASQRQPGRRDNRAAVAMAECCTAAILGRGYTYHHIAEQDDATPGLSESAAALRIPVSPDYTFKNAGTGGAWVRSFSGWMKVRTCDNGGDGWAIAHGPSGSTDPAGEVVAQVESDGLRAALYRSHW